MESWKIFFEPQLSAFSLLISFQAKVLFLYYFAYLTMLCNSFSWWHVLLAQIGVLIEDKEFVESYMNGNPWKAGKFSLSLRLSLWQEHLGLRAEEVC